MQAGRRTSEYDVCNLVVLGRNWKGVVSDRGFIYRLAANLIGSLAPQIASL